jgi:hypothetical protein
MFENRSRKRRRNILLLIVALIFVSAFGLGYYLNFSGDTDLPENKLGQKEASGYKIPSALKNPIVGGIQAEADSNVVQEKEQPANAIPNDLITASTKITFKTYFTLCSHIIDKEPDNGSGFINLSKSDLMDKLPDWTVNEFSSQQVILKREIQTYCPRHYIIGSKDGYIAIYVYNDDGIKILHEMTESPISILTTEDQNNLEYGIVADSEEELQQKLEGLSD